ncbi:MAG: FRG domain-containing protein [Bacteroidetes bacterium GWF2_40_14]|nr:MAG: FRG domain-containing protein [Bacteroidetes bacterium GWF2_40_14]
METKFTWVNTYKEITNWLLTKETEQFLLIEILKDVGVELSNDLNRKGEYFDLNEIDPFTFFSYINKYKKDSRRLEILKTIHAKLGFECEEPTDIVGIPTSHPLKVWLFPFEKFRTNNEINNLWKLFKQVVNRKIDNTLFQKVLSIRSVGKGKLSISFFYTDPEYYLPLDSKTISYIRRYKIKYTFSTVDEYLSISDSAKKNLKLMPYEISCQAWVHRELIDSSYNDEYVKIGSIRTLLDVLDKFNEDSYNENVAIFYRGHSSSKFELKPSIYRTISLISNEDILFKDIIARSPFEFKECDSTFEKLVKMQHYSLPTRLLDITSNPLVALFFACKDDSQENEDGRLYRFEVKERDMKYFDSDAVSVVSNISRRPMPFSIEHLKDEDDRDTVNDDGVIQYLLHEIRSEKPHFSAVIDKKHIGSVFCVKPKLDNPRIIRQEGAFFIFGIDGDKTNPAYFDYDHESYIISKSDKKKILRQLDALGINESTLFPEIEHVAKHLREKY